MNKRAIEAATKAYPPTFSSGKKDAKRIQAERVDTHQPMRTLFIRAYEQAEKDLALTWEDIKFIIQTFHKIVSDAESITSNKAYKETLERFNEQRNGL